MFRRTQEQQHYSHKEVIINANWTFMLIIKSATGGTSVTASVCLFVRLQNNLKSYKQTLMKPKIFDFRPSKVTLVAARTKRKA